MSASQAWRVAQGIIFFHLVFAAMTWSSLPSRIPIHFGAGGQADSWVEPSLFFWFLLVGASVFNHLLIYVLSRPGAQDLWNIPKKDQFLKLSKAKRAPVVELVQIYGAATAVAIGFVFLVLHLGMYLTAKGETDGLAWYVHAVMYGTPVVLLLGLIPWSRAIKKAITQAEGEEEVRKGEGAKA